MCVVLCYCEGGLKFFFCFLPPRDLSTPHDSHVSKDLITGEIAVAIHLLEKPAKYVIPAVHWQPRVDSRLRLPRAVASSTSPPPLLVMYYYEIVLLRVAANCYGVAVGIFTAIRLSPL